MLLGQRERLSSSDVYRINSYYPCPTTIQTSSEQSTSTEPETSTWSTTATPVGSRTCDGASESTVAPHPLDCTKFYLCQGWTALEMKCPAGLLFNARKSICDWPSAVTDCPRTTVPYSWSAFFFCGIRSGFRHFELHASTTKRKIRDFYLKFSGELCAFDTRILTLNKIWFGVRSADEVRRPLLSLMARKKNMNVNKRNHQSALRQPIDVTRGEHFSWLVRWAARFLACFNYDNNIGWRQRRCQFTAHTWLALQAESCSFSDNEKSAYPSNTTCFWITSLLQQVPGLFPTAENTTQTL